MNQQCISNNQLSRTSTY